MTWTTRWRPLGRILVAVVVTADDDLSISFLYCAGIAEYNWGVAWRLPRLFWREKFKGSAAAAERDDIIPDKICNVFSETGIITIIPNHYSLLLFYYLFPFLFSFLFPFLFSFLFPFLFPFLLFIETKSEALQMRARHLARIAAAMEALVFEKDEIFLVLLSRVSPYNVI